MPLIESTDHPPHFDDHILNPFQCVGTEDIFLPNQHIENIRDNCKYVTIQHDNVAHLHPCSTNINILHINSRSMQSNDKFEELQVLLYRTNVLWSVICISETWLTRDEEDKKCLQDYTAFL